MVKISVIIPVYNTEKYLKECLDSIVNQTFTDIEIICINDGSTDGSLKIIKEYENNYKSVKVVSQKNSGLSASRNRGISLAKGDYIYFIDSDDILELTALEELYEISYNNDLDILIFKLINFSDDTYEKYPNNYYEMGFLKQWNKKVFTYKDLGKNALNIAVSAPGKLFKRELIFDMRFPEGLIFEDNAFFAEAMLKAKRVSFYDKHLYNRRRREGSITTTNDLRFSDAIIIMNKVIELIKNHGVYKEFQVALWEKKIHTSYNRFAMVDDKYKDEFFNLIKDDFLLCNDEYNKDGISSKIKRKHKMIYENVLKSENYKIFELNLEIDKIQDANKKLKKQNSKLKNENKKMNYYRNQYESVLKSNSWKITKPLRAITNLFKRS